MEPGLNPRFKPWASQFLTTLLCIPFSSNFPWNVNENSNLYLKFLWNTIRHCVFPISTAGRLSLKGHCIIRSVLCSWPNNPIASNTSSKFCIFAFRVLHQLNSFWPLWWDCPSAHPHPSSQQTSSLLPRFCTSNLWPVWSISTPFILSAPQSPWHCVKSHDSAYSMW